MSLELNSETLSHQESTLEKPSKPDQVETKDLSLEVIFNPSGRYPACHYKL